MRREFVALNLHPYLGMRLQIQVPDGMRRRNELAS
jgi:hypothetical protein